MLRYLVTKSKSQNEKSTNIIGGVTEVISESEKKVSDWVSEGLKPEIKVGKKQDEPSRSEPKYLEFI